MRLRTNAHRLRFIIGSFVLLSCSADGLIRNPRVTRWCDDHPCEWDVEGVVARVGTWHPDDYAVSLVSDDAKLTQVNGTVTQSTSDCFAFSLISKITHGTQVYLELDFLSDGQAEISQRLPESDWEQTTFKLTTPRWYRGVTFTLRKQGPGEAIIAQLSARNAKGECTAPPVALRNRPDGSPCDHDDECMNESCVIGTCGGCEDSDECADDEVCALASADRAQHACLPQSAAAFGTPCDTDEQCESHICENYACSECRGSSCEDGRTCGESEPRSYVAVMWPKLCDPNGHARGSGEPCANDADCASLICEDVEFLCSVACRPSSSSSMDAAADPALNDCLQWCPDGQTRAGHCR